jgi:hypothetical protein
MKKTSKLCKYYILFYNYKFSFHNDFEENAIQDIKFERAILMNPQIFSEGKPLYHLENVDVKIKIFYAQLIYFKIQIRFCKKELYRIYIYQKKKLNYTFQGI